MSGLPDYPEALRRALRVLERRPPPQVETVSLSRAAGRVLAQAVAADRDLPPFDRAMMDGYALRAADYARDRAFDVVGEVAAGAPATVRVPAGAAVKIATGAPLPADCDSVIPHEVSDRRNPVRFRVESLRAGEAVHPRGADAKAGAALLAAGTALAAHHLGIAAAAGAASLPVRVRPRAAIITSGDELVPVETSTAAIAPQQIRNPNGVMIDHLLQRFGGEPARLLQVPDEPEPTIAAVREGLQSCDVLVTVGGVSAGERDHFPAAFDACGVERVLAGAAIQPGRPIVIGRASLPRQPIVVALPGNPVSSLACACLFIWPLVRGLLGLDADLPWRSVQLAAAVKPNAHRRAFRPAIVQADGRVVVPSWAGSGDLAHTAPTHGLVELPVQDQAVAAGALLRFLSWPPA